MIRSPLGTILSSAMILLLAGTTRLDTAIIETKQMSTDSMTAPAKRCSMTQKYKDGDQVVFRMCEATVCGEPSSDRVYLRTHLSKNLVPVRPSEIMGLLSDFPEDQSHDQ
jgi:hypothetical protein